MRQEHRQILTVIADLAGAGAGKEIDEFSLAQRCGIVPPTLPRHTYINSPARARLLRTLTGLEQGKLIYVTKRGYWGMYLTNEGRERLTESGEPAGAVAGNAPPPEREQAPEGAVAEEQPIPPGDPRPPAWQGPRPAPPSLAISARSEYFYSSLALIIVTIGTVLLFGLNYLPQSPLARQQTASPPPQEALTLPFENVPTVAPVSTPTPAPTATPAPPRAGDESTCAARPGASRPGDDTRLEEIGGDDGRGPELAARERGLRARATPRPRRRGQRGAPVGDTGALIVHR